MKRIFQTMILVVAVSALLAPSALADRPDDRAEARGPGALVASSAIRPDDQAGTRGPGSIPPVVVAAGASADGFDWTDAGVGAVGAFGLALLVLGAHQVATRARSDHATA